MTALEHELQEKILRISFRAWEQRVFLPDIQAWLRNFVGAVAPVDEERIHALFMLSNFMYFGSRELRELLRSLYRDLFRYPIIAKIRKRNGDTKDLSLINREFVSELTHTRFVGIGNPSESGVHLLYYFRQENGLVTDLFVDTQRIFSRRRAWFGFLKLRLREPNVRRYIFIDDICGSGHQAEQYSSEVLDEMLRIRPDLEVHYLCLFATSKGLEHVRNRTRFGANAACVFELDDSFKCFSATSRIFAKASAGIDPGLAQRMAAHYGARLYPKHPLGYENGQLLIGFHHNTPDNTLPVVWVEDAQIPWIAIFKRYPKVYALGGSS